MMKYFVNITLALLLCASMGVSAMAAQKSKNVTFNRDFTVNGTLIKKGTYKVRFDDQTGEMIILNGKTIIATTKASLKVRNYEAFNTEVTFKEKNNSSELRAITFDGDNQTITIGDNGDQAAAPQQ